MDEFKKICRSTGKAIFDFSMISEGDKILVCFSGGKDSFVLIRTLLELKKKYLVNFELKAFTVNPGFDSNFLNLIKHGLKDESIDFEIYDSQVSDILESELEKKKFRPCFLCSRMRRGIIYDYAIKNGFNKVALGHTLNDAIETQMMNMFFSSKISLLKPKYLAENGRVEVIRPLIYVDEDLIVNYVKLVNYEPVKNVCPLIETDSKRDYFKKVIADLKKNNSQIMENCQHSFSNVKELNSWDFNKNN